MSATTTLPFTMSLNAQLKNFHKELADSTTRNLQHARPAAASRSSTPRSSDGTKRSHGAAFSTSTSVVPAASKANMAVRESVTQIFTTVNYLREKAPRVIAFTDLISYLSLPVDMEKSIPGIKRALAQSADAEFLPASESPNGKDSFRYRPKHPVTNPEELQLYLARQPTAQGISVKELKDGWPDVTSHIDALEREGHILVARNKKDGVARTVWTDSPTYHILDASTQLPRKVDTDFVEMWGRIKLPMHEGDIRSELEKAGITPTIQVKEVKTGDVRRKEKRRVQRKGGKTTNSHMLGILKEYNKR